MSKRVIISRLVPEMDSSTASFNYILLRFFSLSLSLSPVVEFLGIPSEIAFVKFVKYDVIYLFVTSLCLPIRIFFFFYGYWRTRKKEGKRERHDRPLIKS